MGRYQITRYVENHEDENDFILKRFYPYRVTGLAGTWHECCGFCTGWLYGYLYQFHEYNGGKQNEPGPECRNEYNDYRISSLTRHLQQAMHTLSWQPRPVRKLMILTVIL